MADNIRVVKNTPEMAHILMAKGESGLYGYVICKNIKHRRLGGEMRTMYRLDRDIFDWAYVAERTGQQLRYAELVQYPAVQDETWKMPDGSIYQKYDYSGYMAENPMLGPLRARIRGVVHAGEHGILRGRSAAAGSHGASGCADLELFSRCAQRRRRAGRVQEG